MAQIDDWRIVSGQVAPGQTFTIEVDMSGGGADTGLIIGALDRESCFADATGLNPTPGITVSRTATIPSDFQGTVVIAYSAFGHCGSGAQGWVGGGIWNGVTTIDDTDPSGDVFVSECSTPGGAVTPEQLQTQGVPVSVTVVNDNFADLELSVQINIGNLSVPLPDTVVQGRSTVQIDGQVDPLTEFQVQDIGTPIEGDHPVSAGMYRIDFGE